MMDGHEKWTCRMNMQQGHAARTFSKGGSSKDIQQGGQQQGHSARTFGKDMQHGQAAWTSSMDIGYAS
jgi:hypothetical protein